MDFLNHKGCCLWFAAVQLLTPLSALAAENDPSMKRHRNNAVELSFELHGAQTAAVKVEEWLQRLLWS